MLMTSLRHVVQSDVDSKMLKEILQKGGGRGGWRLMSLHVALRLLFFSFPTSLFLTYIFTDVYLFVISHVSPLITPTVMIVISIVWLWGTLLRRASCLDTLNKLGSGSSLLVFKRPAKLNRNREFRNKISQIGFFKQSSNFFPSSGWLGV